MNVPYNIQSKWKKMKTYLNYFQKVEIFKVKISSIYMQLFSFPFKVLIAESNLFLNVLFSFKYDYIFD